MVKFLLILLPLFSHAEGKVELAGKIATATPILTSRDGTFEEGALVTAESLAEIQRERCQRLKTHLSKEQCLFPKAFTLWSQNKSEIDSLIGQKREAILSAKGWTIYHLRAGLWRENPFYLKENGLSEELSKKIVKHIILQRLVAKSFVESMPTFFSFIPPNSGTFGYIQVPIVYAYFSSINPASRIAHFSNAILCQQGELACFEFKAATSELVQELGRTSYKSAKRLEKAFQLVRRSADPPPFEKMEELLPLFETDQKLDSILRVEWQRVLNDLLNGETSFFREYSARLSELSLSNSKVLMFPEKVKKWVQFLIIKDFLFAYNRNENLEVNSDLKKHLKKSYLPSFNKFTQDVMSIEDEIFEEQFQFFPVLDGSIKQEPSI